MYEPIKMENELAKATIFKKIPLFTLEEETNEEQRIGEW